MAKSKSAKYFCENCGEEVAANARFCPHCGRFFSAVRCPQCGYMGAVTAFKDGCPKCHYAMTPDDIFGTPSTQSNTNKSVQKKEKKSKKSINAKSLNKPQQTRNDDAPIWLYIVSLIVLFIILGIIFTKMGLF
ncbi:MAG: zinc ribbon domain-containing protein [Treponema sp.]|nr:zinc ribbon domain-containing protein [Treponema sp.]